MQTRLRRGSTYGSPILKKIDTLGSSLLFSLDVLYGRISVQSATVENWIPSYDQLVISDKLLASVHHYPLPMQLRPRRIICNRENV